MVVVVLMIMMMRGRKVVMRMDTWWICILWDRLRVGRAERC